MIAFQQLTSLKQNQMSERQAADLLEVPFSTMHSWKTHENDQEIDPELTEFISTLVGQKFLTRLESSAHMVIRYGHGGIRGLQEFLELSHLNNFVTSSAGALHAFVVRAKKHILTIGANQEMLFKNHVEHSQVSQKVREVRDLRIIF